MASRSRTYKLDLGLQQLIGLALEHVLMAEVEKWKAEVETGEISEQARQVFVALGWMTQRDVRSTAVPGVQPLAPRRIKLNALTESTETNRLDETSGNG